MQPLKLPELDLKREVLELLLQIPRGKVTTYQALARALGDEIAARAVGQLMAANEEPDRYPCYRVVHSTGEVGSYSGPGGPAEKIRRLQAEGIEVKGGRIVNLRRYLFTEFRSSRPLRRLRRLQEELAARIRLEPDRADYGTVAGVDVSYTRGSRAVAGYALFEPGGSRPLLGRTLAQNIGFPYIPTYLAFRELPILQALLSQAEAEGRLADVILVDGNGILHPRHVGIASHLGVLLDVPTIGVAKSLLCGEVDQRGMKPGEVRYVLLRGERVGAAVKLRERAEPIYISPGHRIDLERAIEVVLRCSTGRRKLPEPLQAAHELSQKAARELKFESASTSSSADDEGERGREREKEEGGEEKGQLALGL